MEGVACGLAGPNEAWLGLAKQKWLWRTESHGHILKKMMWYVYIYYMILYYIYDIWYMIYDIWYVPYHFSDIFTSNKWGKKNRISLPRYLDIIEWLVRSGADAGQRTPSSSQGVAEKKKQKGQLFDVLSVYVDIIYIDIYIYMYTYNMIWYTTFT